MLLKILISMIVILGALYAKRIVRTVLGDALGQRPQEPRRPAPRARKPDPEEPRAELPVEDLIECPRCGRWNEPTMLCPCRTANKS